MLTHGLVSSCLEWFNKYTERLHSDYTTPTAQFSFCIVIFAYVRPSTMRKTAIISDRVIYVQY